MREPIEEIFAAAELLDAATTSHLNGDRSSANELIRAADMPEVRAWTESLWGAKGANTEQASYHRFRRIADAPPHLPRLQRNVQRMPSAQQRADILARYGRHCVFCGIPLIRKEIQKAFTQSYPEAASWGRTNLTQHAAFQCMWMQFDHLLPHCRGGDNATDNVVVTCAPCNFARGHRTLDEVGSWIQEAFPPREQHGMVWNGF